MSVLSLILLRMDSMSCIMRCAERMTTPRRAEPSTGTLARNAGTPAGATIDDAQLVANYHGSHHHIAVMEQIYC